LVSARVRRWEVRQVGKKRPVTGKVGVSHRGHPKEGSPPSTLPVLRPQGERVGVSWLGRAGLEYLRKLTGFLHRRTRRGRANFGREHTQQCECMKLRPSIASSARRHRHTVVGRLLVLSCGGAPLVIGICQCASFPRGKAASALTHTSARMTGELFHSATALQDLR
jgi:hypothetical protein